MEQRKQDITEDKKSEIARSSRFFETEDGWFFRTRENISLGPYQLKFDAEVSASLLITRLDQLEKDKDPGCIIQAFETDPSNCTLGVEHSAKLVDLKAIRRKRQIDSAVKSLQKTWAAIARVEFAPQIARIKRLVGAKKIGRLKKVRDGKSRLSPKITAMRTEMQKTR